MIKICCIEVEVYWCPTGKEYECAAHGGFSVCCSHPELHKPKFDHNGGSGKNYLPGWLCKAVLARSKSKNKGGDDG